jgi:cathepsin B
MKVAVVALAILAVAAANKIRFDPLSDEHINYINSLGTTWKAGRNWAPDTPIENIRKLLGTKRDGEKTLKIKHHDIKADDIPDTFDAREEWPDCETISDIRDQADCGSCWAFGAVEAMSDRYCILFGETVRISAQELLTCCGSCASGLGTGCDGGEPNKAWEYWVKNGLVTGGLYGTTDTCQPYTLEPCDHHVTGSYEPCPSATDATPDCSKECISAYDVDFTTDKHFGAEAYGISKEVSQIQAEIQANGPVEADFNVYEDFLTYKSGVYQHVSGSYEGGHAVKILGWGTEDGTDYWLIANSWNEDWGLSGYFKMLRGSNECGIEADIQAGTPKQYSS